MLFKILVGTFILRFSIVLLQVTTFLDYDKSSEGIVFTTDRPYQPGEQVNNI